jgi:DNA-cytosine methyltransferase
MNIEIFCCSGGMAEGFRRAGITFDLAFDWSKDACDSYAKNLGHRPIQMDVHDLVRMVGALVHGHAHVPWAGGTLWDVDLLVADPPCTPWSRAGKRQGLADPKDMIGPTFELIRLLRPKAFLIGNVPGLDDDKNWNVMTERLQPFHKLGYCVADFLRLDAADYGVPQHRVRPFWYGHRIGRCLRIPPRTHCDPKDLRTCALFDELLPWVTCRQALGHLPPAQLGKPVRLRHRSQNGTQIASIPDRPARVVGTSNLSDGNVLAPAEAAIRKKRKRAPDEVNMSSPSEEDKPSRSIRSSPRGAQALLTNERHPINQPDAPSYTLTSKGDGRGAQGACVMQWPWDRPSTTIQQDERIPPPGHHDEFSTRSMPNAVRLSEKAAAILQGFPEDWLFAGKTKKARWAQIGMAMPPALAQAVGREIKAAMEAPDVVYPQRSNGSAAQSAE